MEQGTPLHIWLVPFRESWGQYTVRYLFLGESTGPRSGLPLLPKFSWTMELNPPWNLGNPSKRYSFYHCGMNNEQEFCIFSALFLVGRTSSSSWKNFQGPVRSSWLQHLTRRCPAPSCGGIPSRCAGRAGAARRWRGVTLECGGMGSSGMMDRGITHRNYPELVVRFGFWFFFGDYEKFNPWFVVLGWLEWRFFR